MVGHDGLVVLPPAAQGKGLGGRAAVHIKGDSKLFPKFRFYSQQLQHMGISGGLIRALLGQTALHWVAELPVGLVCIGPANLHM